MKHPATILLLFFFSSLNLKAQTLISDSAFIRYCCDDTNSIEKPLNSKWLTLDITVIKEKINKLPTSSKTLDDVKLILPYLFDTKYHNCLTKTIDLGYGVKLIKHTFYGGYSSFYWEAICFDKYVLKARTSISSRRDLMSKYYFNTITIPVKCLDKTLTNDVIYYDNYKKYISDSSKLFIDTFSVYSRRNEALEYFSNVLSFYDYEPFHVEYDFFGRGFDHIRYFIANNDIEGLESLLFCVNSAGRLIAARTLLYMRDRHSYKPDENALRRINDILNGSHKISMGIISCHIGRFDYDYYDIITNFEKYLIDN
jgi:hypothetical protein